jgi:heme/copper-type cytochrome/quinol oxidase subunit 1
MFNLGFFNPAYGGDPILFQHMFWFYSHPAVYIMILPAMGVISEIIPTFARKPIFGYDFIAASSIGIAVIGFIVWAHHMFLTGQSTYSAVAFSFLTFLVAVPSAVKVFNWSSLPAWVWTFISTTPTLSSLTSTTSWWAARLWVISAAFTSGGPRLPAACTPNLWRALLPSSCSWVST